MRLKEALRDVLTPQESALLVGSFDIVGDIAIIIIAPELAAKEHLIAQAIVATHKHVKTVAKRAGNYDGEFRTIALQVIGGEDLHETEHRENGVRFFLDPGKAYYSVRSSNERKRIARQVRPGERILVMFSGVGAFPLVLAANSPAAEIVGIEKNPLAHQYAVKSLKGNRRVKNVELIAGDVRDVLPRLHPVFDRILMPLPLTAADYLETALPLLRPGGTLHFYDFQAHGDFPASVVKVHRACEAAGRHLAASEVVVCGHCSPKTYRICVDAVIE